MWSSHEHNLSIESLSVPKRKLVVFTGVSGSGKSSLAFDTLYAEGQRRYVESLSTYARQFLERLPRPDVDEIGHLPPAIAIEQHNHVTNARSTIVHSMFLIVTGGSLIPKTHDPSYGAGQTRPVNSGKLLVACKRSIAACQ